MTSESSKLKAAMDVDSDMMAALTAEEDGIFRRGALPQMECATASGNKELLDAVAKVDWL